MTTNGLESKSSTHSSPGQLIPLMNCKRQDYLHWDDYFMATAVLSSQRSKDPVTQVGAVIVNEDNRIVAIGYNGFPSRCEDDEFPWYKLSEIEDQLDKDQQLDPMNDKKMFVVHAEANAILNKNCANLKNTRLYTTLFPCNECAKLIVQSGISKVFYISDKYADKPIYRASRLMFGKARIECERYVPKQKKIVIDFDRILNEDLNLTQEIENFRL
ncbi:probable deoxycytidylate deaminase [Stomoxys calcitrans]|uniref:Probable deoxycytidylate deaminase n=1 Tax=Stomoxys calcitrans TaxID=35570 RepID=A0A1I8Q7L6_STOCA|nr:probable deoxycytidylate deaminase [Stomoxys calcitrans]